MTSMQDTDIPLDSDSDDATRDRRFVTALARGLDLLRCFEPGDVGLSNLEIARRTRLPKPTVSRLTYTLTELGYLTQSKTDGTYHLGAGVLSLGYAMLSGLDIRQRARPLMQEIADELDTTIAIGARDRMEMVYLEVCRGPGPVTLRIEVGNRIPLATTAMGRSLLAALPEDERLFFLERIHERMGDVKAFTKLKNGVQRAVRDIGKKGFCLSLGDWRPDVNAIGVPLMAADRTVYGLICGGPAFRTSRDFLQRECGPRLVEAAQAISAVS